MPPNQSPDRSGRELAPPTARRHYIGVDVGGTKILAVATDAGDPATILAEVEEPTAPAPGESAGRVDQRLDVLVSRLRAGLEETSRLAGIGIGLPGLVTRAGVLRYGPNLPGVTELDVAAWLAQRHGVPVGVDNDGNCAAWAEYRLGAGRPVAPEPAHDGGPGLPSPSDDQPMVFIGLGTGISCGLVIGGARWRGVAGFAGEPGHMIVTDGGARCACGRLGCWEAVASGTALARAARAAVAEGRAPGLLAAAGGRIDAVDGHHVSEGLSHGDPDALEVAEHFADQVALGLANLVHLLDPAVVVLGGSVLTDAEVWMKLITTAYERRLMQPAMRVATRLVAATLGRRAGAVGAALIAADAAAP